MGRVCFQSASSQKACGENVKQCSKCLNKKSLSEFNKDKRDSSGYQSRCRDCQRSWHRNNYADNIEFHREKSKKNYWSNREQCLARNKDWCKKNNERRRFHARSYYQRHRLKRIESSKFYRLRNPNINRLSVKKWREKNLEYAKFLISRWSRNHREERNHSKAIRRAKKRANGGSGISKKEWDSLKEKYAGLCYYCESDGVLTMDHFIPITKGGKHEKENIVPACVRCNCRKGNLMPDQFLQKMARQAKRLAGMR